MVNTVDLHTNNCTIILLCGGASSTDKNTSLISLADTMADPEFWNKGQKDRGGVCEWSYAPRQK